MPDQAQKIKLVVGISDFRVGGAQKLVVDVLNHINHAKFDVHLLVCVKAGDEATFFPQLTEKVTVHHLDFKNLYDVKSYYSTAKLLKSIAPDIVWSNLFFANTVFRILKLIVGYTVISIEQNTYVNKSLSNKILDHILSYFTFRIVAVSNYVADFTAKQEKIARSKFHVIYNGVDTETLQQQIATVDRTAVMEESGLSADNKLILNIGQFIYQKNQKLLIEAFAEFVAKNDTYRLLVLGDGVKRTELEAAIATHNLEGKVLLPGIKKQVARYFTAADMFVLSSRFEGFPLVIAEALACGLPVVSTPVSGSDSYIDEGKNGFLVKSDASSLAKGMKAVAELDDIAKNSFSKRSQEIAKEFDIKKITTAYEELFIYAL